MISGPPKKSYIPLGSRDPLKAPWDPGILSKDPGILSKDPGILLKDPGVLLKDPGVLLKGCLKAVWHTLF